MASRRERSKSAPKAPANPLLAPAIASAVLVVAASFEGGPLGFLAPAVRWPLVVASLFALWRPALEKRGLRWPAWAPGAGEAAGVALVLGAYFLLKTIGFHATDTDDNIYFYMAKRMGQGLVPYRDFFFAHPPVHLLVPALVFKALGFSIGVAKAIPFLAQAGAGLCLYLALRKASRPLAVAALLMHLLAYEVLMGATEMDGENLMTLFLALAVLLAARGRPVASGVAMGLSLGTGLYSLAGAVALALGFAGVSRRALGRYGLGLGGCIALWVGIFWALGGDGFVDGVFRYHFAKAPRGDHIPVFGSANPFSIASAYLQDLVLFLGSRVFGKAVFWHAPQYVAFVLGVGLAVRPALAQPLGAGPLVKGARKLLAALLSGTPQGFALLGGAAGILFLLQWAALNEVYDFYMVPQLALMSLPAGYALVRIGSLAAAAASARALLAPGLLAAGFGLSTPLAHAIHDGLWPDELRDRGQVATYVWRDPEVLVGPARVAKALFFRDHRLKGEPNPPYQHYLWNKSLTFSAAKEIAAHVAATSAPDETITGASTSTPLVALLADRRMARDEADTNNKRFRSGLLTDRDFWERICADKLRFVLAAPKSHYTEEFMAKDPVAQRFFARERTFVDPSLRHFRAERFQLFRRIDGAAGLPEGKVCTGQ